MALAELSNDKRAAAEHRFATLALSLSQIRGLKLGGDRLGQIVQNAMASASPEELRSPHGITTAALGRLDGLLTSAMASGPTNIHSAEAARLAQMGAHGAAAILGHKGYAELQRANREARGESGSGNKERSSSASYDGMGGTGSSVNWSSSAGQAMTRSYAVSNNMSWATTQPDLMRMGKPALQALNEVHLKGDGYHALRDTSGMGLDNNTIVGAAGYMKRNNLNYNDAAKASNKLYKDPTFSAEEHGEVKAIMKQSAKVKTEADNKALQERTGKARTRFKAAHPDKAEQIDDWAKKMGATKEEALEDKVKLATEEAKAGGKAVKADIQTVKADVQPIKADVKAMKADVKDEKAKIKDENAEVKNEKAEMKVKTAEIAEARSAEKKSAAASATATTEKTSDAMAEMIKKRQAAKAATPSALPKAVG